MGARFIGGEIDSNNFSVAPGLPSLATTAAFTFSSLSGFFWLIRAYRLSSLVAVPIVTFGAVALVGYAVGDPSLYWYIPPYSGAMALHTAFAFTMLGLSLGDLRRD